MPARGQRIFSDLLFDCCSVQNFSAFVTLVGLKEGDTLCLLNLNIVS